MAAAAGAALLAATAATPLGFAGPVRADGITLLFTVCHA